LRVARYGNVWCRFGGLEGVVRMRLEACEDIGTRVLSAVEAVGCEGIGKMHMTQLFCSGPLDTFRRCLSAF